MADNQRDQNPGQGGRQGNQGQGDRSQQSDTPRSGNQDFDHPSDRDRTTGREEGSESGQRGQGGQGGQGGQRGRTSGGSRDRDL